MNDAGCEPVPSESHSGAPREQYSTDTIKAADLANAVDISVNVLQRPWQSHYGASVSDFIHRWRLEKSSHALEIEGISIAEAAFFGGIWQPCQLLNGLQAPFWGFS